MAIDEGRTTNGIPDTYLDYIAREACEDNIRHTLDKRWQKQHPIKRCVVCGFKLKSTKRLYCGERCRKTASSIRITKRLTPGWVWVGKRGSFTQKKDVGAHCLLYVGKWLIFGKITPNLIKKLSISLNDGLLGDIFKFGGKVICVYTNDYRDIDDVMRVRQSIHNVGITDKIPYKPDIYTYKRIKGSIYFE